MNKYSFPDSWNILIKISNAVNFKPRAKRDYDWSLKEVPAPYFSAIL
jgi:hypothetical protein